MNSCIFSYDNLNRNNKKQLEEMKKLKAKRIAPENDKISESLQAAISSKKKKTQDALKLFSNIEDI